VGAEDPVPAGPGVGAPLPQICTDSGLVDSLSVSP